MTIKEMAKKTRVGTTSSEDDDKADTGIQLIVLLENYYVKQF